MYDRTRSSRQWVWLASTILLYTLACGGTEQPRDSSGSPDRAGTIAGEDNGYDPDDPASDKVMPEALTDSFHNYKSADLRKMIEPKLMSRAGLSKARRCASDEESLDCQLLIQPVAGSKNVSLDTNQAATFPKHGIIVAKIRNVGDDDEIFLNIPARRDVYWLVRPAAAGGGFESVLIDLRGRMAKAVGREKPLFGRECKPPEHPDHAPESSSRGAFRCCGVCPEDPEARVRMISHKTPPWFVCATGCCYAEE